MKTFEVGGIAVPGFMYGTAWKEERTAALVGQALAAGFRAIDTANQRKHYHEAGVGEALRRALGDGIVSRDALFLQTKYTFQRGQDERLPYDPAAPIADQVQQSFERSLTHLGVSVIDSLVLHGPTNTVGLADQDYEAWGAMERVCTAGGARCLGVSNIAAAQLEALLTAATVAPSFVQNRCYAARGWDADVRAVCRGAGVVYQGFSLLTANRQVVAHPEVRRIAEVQGRTAAQVIFKFAASLGMLPLTGTTSAQHMREDLQSDRVMLTEADCEALWAVSTAPEPD